MIASEIHGQCRVCGSNKTVRDSESGETICPDCGYVYPLNLIYMGPEWHAFTLQERNDKPRAGPPLSLTMHDHGLNSSISGQNRDYAGRLMDPDDRSRFYRLRKWNRRAKLESGNQRNLATALGFLSHMGDRLNVPKSVTETAALAYRQALRKGATRGRGIKNLVAASLYVGCRMCGVSISLAAVAEAANISKKEAARNYRYLHDVLEHDVPGINSGKIVSMLVSQLNRSGCVERVALDVLDAASELRITSGRSPSGMAAAAFYIGCCALGEKVTQSSIASLARVTEVTIRNRYKEMVECVDIEVLV